MFIQITNSSFHDAFRDHNRLNQFSYYGLNALFDHLAELEADCGKPIELDVIALCCDYAEYNNLAAFQADYPGYESIEEIADLTTVIMIPEYSDTGLQNNNSFIIQQF